MWYKILQIVDWFGEFQERAKLIKDFNTASKDAFINGTAPTLLKINISKGDNNYKHQFSKFFASGLRIKTLSGKSLSREELSELANVILDNEQVVRKLISLGWDTLEVQDNVGFIGLKFALKKFANIGGYLN